MLPLIVCALALVSGLLLFTGVGIFYFLVIFFLILVATLLYGYLPGLLLLALTILAVASGVIWGGLSLERAVVIRGTVFFITSIAFTGYLRLVLQSAQDREVELQALYNLVRNLNKADTMGDVLDQAAAAIMEMFAHHPVSSIALEEVGTSYSQAGMVASGRQVRIPVAGDDPAAGALVVRVDDARSFSQRDLDLLKVVATEIHSTSARLALTNQLRKQAITDALTSVFNHGYFEERLREEVARARRYNRPVSLLMMDMDDFKSVNDQYGHPVGDAVLRTVATWARETVRKCDVVCRYGGEEFAVILPETSEEQTLPVAKRLLEQLNTSVMPGLPSGLHCTATLGVATFPTHSESWSGLLAAADRALYQAKRAGKNRLGRLQDDSRQWRN